MLRTYRAILHDNQVEWTEPPPEKSEAIQVYITVLEEQSSMQVLESLQQRGRVMSEALAELARRGTFSAVIDPVTWQRKLRSERVLPDRKL